MIKRIIKSLLLTLVPALCACISQYEDGLVDLQAKGLLPNNWDITSICTISGLLSIAFTFLLLTIPLCISDYKKEIYSHQREALLKNNKKAFEAAVEETLSIHCKFNVRIFTPQVALLHCIRKLFQRKKDTHQIIFCIRNVNGLADEDHTDNLKFEVFPNQQGLVGRCYNEEKMLYDDDLKKTNEKNYNLNKYQISKTNQLNFVLVCPVFSESNKVVAVVSFDSCDEVKVARNKKDKVGTLFFNYSQSLYDTTPELFKKCRKGLI